MASGKVHALASMIVAPNGVMQLPSNQAGLAWGVGAILSTLITPDLDLLDSSGNYSLYILRETFGRFSPIVEAAWKAWWFPYSRIIPHRSWLSHFPVVSTLIRCVYIAPFTFLLWLIFGNDLQYVILAMTASDISHFIMDWKGWRLIGAFTQ